MGRALSTSDLLNKKYKLFDFEDEWFDAFDRPERHGVWFIWGGSGNGKTTFVLELVKYLAKFGKVAYNSLEEGSAHTMQKSFKNVGMAEVARRVILIEGETIDELDKRMGMKKSADFFVIDSVQYAELNFKRYKALKEAHKGKLIILISHADGKIPQGRPATSMMHDASLKIWVEGYRAFSKGRYIGDNGGVFTIWHEGAARYWGE